MRTLSATQQTEGSPYGLGQSGSGRHRIVGDKGLDQRLKFRLGRMGFGPQERH